MCGRYSLATTPKEIEKRFNVDPKNLEIQKDRIKARYNIGPGQNTPVIVLDDTGNKTIELMRWGYLPFWAKDINEGYRYINARDDSVFNKPTWKKAILNARCIIPATSYFEWVKEGKEKHPFVHKVTDQEVFGFAGIWSVWKDVEGMEWHTFAIITTKPNKESAAIHDRMPVILHPSEEDDWLNPDLTEPEQLSHFLRSYEDGKLEIYETSPAVNTLKLDHDQLIKPLNSA